MSEYLIFETQAGWVGVVYSSHGVTRTYLPEPRGALKQRIAKENPESHEANSAKPELVDQLIAYFRGEPVTFRTRFDWSDATDFEQEVWRACFRIPYGRTLSYKQLAEKVGRPRAARAVGTAMKRNRCPIVVPCHRVLASGGKIGGYSGTGGVELKRGLLEMEQRALAPA